MSIEVLLADDHQVVCDGLEVLLNSEADISVVHKSANGRDAVFSVRELQPDIVIMDINMPELNGLEATQQIMETNTSTRVIILSMYAHNDLIFRALKSGAKGYILKDSAGVEVVDAVRAVHAGCRYLSKKIEDEVIDEYIRLQQDSRDSHPLSSLSPREREVLQLILDGKSRVEIAETLCLSKKTVDTYRNRIMQKLDIHDIPSLVKFAIQHGLTTLE
jgi:DNA-binding NarL/FixJ family response regulator